MNICPVYTSQDRQKRLREGIYIPWPQKQATKISEATFTSPVKNSTSRNDPGVRDTALDFRLSPAHWQVRCHLSSKEILCCGEEHPQNYCTWSDSNLPTMNIFHLWVPTVEVSTPRSVCSGRHWATFQFLAISERKVEKSDRSQKIRK